MDTKYIWTNHALARMRDRKISEELIVKTLTFPDAKNTREKGGLEFRKKIDERTVAVIIKRNDHKQNLIVSCWINPPFPGTKDFRLRKRYIQIKNAHGLKKLWLKLLYRIGI